MASGVVSTGSRDQGLYEGGEKGLAAAAGVMDELEEAEIGGQLLLGDATVRPQPGAQQRPETFGRVDVDLAEAVAIVIPRVLAAAMADGFVAVAPGAQAGVDIILIGVDEAALSDGGLDDGLNSLGNSPGVSGRAAGAA